MNKEAMLAVLDSTLLKPTASRTDITIFCEETIQYGFKTVFVNPYWIPYAVKMLSPHGIKVGVPIGFSLGGATTNTKIAETAEAVENGAVEIDMLINIGALKSREYNVVKQDIAAVVHTARGNLTKVIIETALLSQEEKVAACKIIMEAGADYVKTATGFNGGGATIEDIKLLKSVTGNSIKIKAAGGIRSWQDACAMLEAGASRLGTSNAVKIINEEKIDGDY
ncbi:deoxyribose-phosphate aldolase [Propionispira raffinosivorans]|uniref:deoxyribose-phosphate aldolase n=1 Tax=Propionispira raffinosivorans TaxID=86959 RepID=UPI00037FE7B6|nr:deoxyribose-phosphate aldolase [Propionispira raffinosivorans]